MIGIMREPVLSKDRYGGASHQRRVRQNLLQVCRCGKQLLPFRQVAFGHRNSRSDTAVRTDQTSEVRTPEESAVGCPCDLWRHREAVSSHQAGREQSRRLLQPVSTQNDSGDGATRD
jgi:hypothetical protein